MGHTAPQSAADQEQREFRLELAADVLSRCRVYLDTCFWVHLRNTALGRPGATAYADLLHLIEGLVDSGRAVCPLEATTIMELLGQDDLSTRRATAALMDQLSKGVCIIPPPERRQTEILYFLMKFQAGAAMLHHPRELVWTRPGSIMGEFVNQAWSSEELQPLQIGFQQYLRGLPLTAILKILESGCPFPREDSDARARELNEGKFSHAHELRSFAKARLIEIRGGLDGLADVFRDALCSLQAKESKKLAPEEEMPSLADMKGILRGIQEGFRKGRIGTDLPCINVPATLHAAIRWDRSRPYDRGDRMDIQHAAAAMPYCDLFLTDSAMATLIRSNHVQLDAFYGCKVAAGAKEATQAVHMLD